ADVPGVGNNEAPALVQPPELAPFVRYCRHDLLLLVYHQPYAPTVPASDQHVPVDRSLLRSLSHYIFCSRTLASSWFVRLIGENDVEVGCRHCQTHLVRHGTQAAQNSTGIVSRSP